jgi:hypothetical protein
MVGGGSAYIAAAWRRKKASLTSRRCSLASGASGAALRKSVAVFASWANVPAEAWIRDQLSVPSQVGQSTPLNRRSSDPRIQDEALFQEFLRWRGARQGN